MHQPTRPAQHGFWTFWLLWIASHGLIWFASAYLVVYFGDMLGIVSAPRDLFILLFIASNFFIPGVWTSLIQRSLVRLRFELDLPRWRSLSIAGWIISSLGFAMLTTTGILNGVPTAVVFGLVFGLAALVQWRSLKTLNPDRAWLWILAAITSGALFSVPIASGVLASSALVIGMSGAFHAAVTGLIMHRLIEEMLPAESKAKVKRSEPNRLEASHADDATRYEDDAAEDSFSARH